MFAPRKRMADSPLGCRVLPVTIWNCMNIVVVESPAKAKTINKYLGSGYEVLASFGHVRDLPAKDGSVDPEQNFRMIWQVDDKAQKRLNDIAEEAQAPVRLRHFASWFMIELPSDAQLATLFFAYLRHYGVHIWEGRPGFLTLAHSDDDLDRIAEAFGRSIEEMQRAGFPSRPARPAS